MTDADSGPDSDPISGSDIPVGGKRRGVSRRRALGGLAAAGAVAAALPVTLSACDRDNNTPAGPSPKPEAEWPDRTHLPIEPYQKVGKIAPDGQGLGPDRVAEGDLRTAGSAERAAGDDRRRGLRRHRACSAVRFRHRPTTGSRRAVCVTTASTPPRVCSPSRAALITGRNHHVASTGIIMEFSTPYPGYHSLVSRSVGTIGEILTGNGYGTAWFGKNHNVPDWQTTPAGPFNLWPTGLGLRVLLRLPRAPTRTSSVRPIYENTTPVDPYLGREDTYHLDADMADHAIKWIRTQKAVNPDKPFLAYYTPGTAHAPHHAPKEWIDKFKGKFDMGWDELREQTFEQAEETRRHPAGRRAEPDAR